MSNNKIFRKHADDRPIKLLVFGTGLITLFIYTPANDPFNTPKLILLMAIAGWLTGYVVSALRKNFTVYKNHLALPFFLLLLFIVSLIISTFLTDVKITGLIGDTQRRNGLFQYLSLLIIFLFATLHTNFRNSLQIYKGGIVTGIVLSSYGVLQITGNDIFKWDNPYNSMIGTLGNPNFASAMLAILFIISISSIVLNEIPLWYKVIAVIASLMSLFAIIKSNSRQGLLVIGISIIFYLTVYLYLKSKKIGRLIGFVSLAISCTAILGMLQSGPLSALLYKDSVSVRGFYWRAGLEMFKSNWLTGIGVDRYEYYFKQFREPEYSLRYGYEITSSNAHNTFIQFFATSGIVVGLSYLLILGYIFYSISTILTRLNTEDQKKALGLLSGWVGFQSQSLISIDNIGVSIWGWVMGGSLLGLILNYKKTKDKVVLQETRKSKLVQIDLFQPIVSFVVIIPVIITGYLLMKSETATFLTRSNALSTNQINKEIAIEQARKVLSNPLSDPRYKLYVSIGLYDLGYQNEAEENLQKLIILDPRNIDFLRTLLVIESKNNNTLQQIEIRKKIEIYDPWNVENYLELCKLYLNIGENSKALELKKKIQMINPNSEFSTNVEKLFLNE